MPTRRLGIDGSFLKTGVMKLLEVGNALFYFSVPCPVRSRLGRWLSKGLNSTRIILKRCVYIPGRRSLACVRNRASEAPQCPAAPGSWNPSLATSSASVSASCLRSQIVQGKDFCDPNMCCFENASFSLLSSDCGEGGGRSIQVEWSSEPEML